MEIGAVVGPASSSTRTFAFLRLGAPGGAVEIAAWLSLVHATALFFFSLRFLEERSIVNSSSIGVGRNFFIGERPAARYKLPNARRSAFMRPLRFSSLCAFWRRAASSTFLPSGWGGTVSLESARQRDTSCQTAVAVVFLLWVLKVLPCGVANRMTPSPSYQVLSFRSS